MQHPCQSSQTDLASQTDAPSETCELLVTVTPTTVEVHLSVDGAAYRLLSLVEAARLLSDLAMATTASVLVESMSLPISVGQVGES